MKKGRVRSKEIVLLLLLLGLAAFTQAAMTEIHAQSCARQTTQQTQNLFDVSCAGTYPAICQDTGDRLFCDDASAETGDSYRAGSNHSYGGVQGTYFNSSITDCASVKSVSLCYKFWCSTAACDVANHICTVGIDANSGASWTDSSAACLAAEAAGVTCINVTASESWNCTQFFAAGTTRALAKAQAQRTGGGTGAKTWIFDVLTLNVTYTSSTDTTTPAIDFVDPTPANNTFLNTSQATVNISTTDNSEVAACTLTFDGVNETMTEVGSGASVNCNLAKTALAEGVHTYKAYANDSTGNENQTQTQTFTVDTTYPSLNLSVNTSVLILGQDSIKISWLVNDTHLEMTALNVTLPNGTLLSETNNNSGEISYPPAVLTSLGTYLVRLEANDLAGNTNLTNTTFTVTDNHPPTIDFVDPTPGNNTFWDSTTATINITAENDVAISRCTLTFDDINETMTNVGSGASVSCNLAKTALAQGTHTYKAYANDSSGNENQTGTRTITVDTINPALDVTINVTTVPLVGTTATITWTTQDTNLESKVLNVTFPNGTMLIQTIDDSLPLILSPSELIVPGVYGVRAMANDSAGNSNQTTTAFTDVDVSLPTIDFISPTPINNSFVNASSVTVNLSAGDDIEINICTLAFDGQNETMTTVGSGASVTCHAVKSGLGEGAHTFRAYVVDSSGNENQTALREFIVDTILPSLNLSLNATVLEFNTDSINISWQANDSNLHTTAFNLTYPNGTLVIQTNNNSGALVYPPTVLVAEGTYLLRTEANDSAGWLQQANTTFLVSSSQDLAAPLIAFVNPTPENNSIVNTSFTINASIEDLVAIGGCSLELDGVNESATLGGGNTFCFSSKTGVSEGTYVFRLFVNDTSGNINLTEPRTITVDGTLPEINLTLNATTAELNQSSLLLSWQISDIHLNLTLINITFPNGSLIISSENNSGNFTLTPLELISSGIYSVQALADDSAGNKNETEITFSVNDTILPTLIFSLNDSTIELGEEAVNITWSAADPNLQSVIFNLTFPNGTLLAQTENVSGRLLISDALSAVGTYTARLSANDSLGNMKVTAITFVVNDTLSPILSGTIPTSGSIFDYPAIIELAVNVTDASLIDKVQANVTYPNGTDEIISLLNTLERYNGSFVSPPLLGQYTIIFIANDSLGNQNNSAAIQFTVNATDDDNDFVPDANDTLLGNESAVTASGIVQLNITVGGLPPTGNTFTGTQTILFQDGTSPFLNFSHNFSTSTLNLSRIRITRTATALIVNISDQLQENETKTLLITDDSFLSFCVKDAEIASLAEISLECTEEDETDLSACLGNSSGITQQGISCRDDNNTLIVSGLNHSALLGTQAEAAAETTVVAGGGGSGGGRANGDGGTVCPEGMTLQRGKCVTLAGTEERTGPEEPEVLFDIILTIPPGRQEIEEGTRELPLEITFLKFGGTEIDTEVLLTIQLLHSNDLIQEWKEDLAVRREEKLASALFLPLLPIGEYQIKTKIVYGERTGESKLAESSAAFTVIAKRKENLPLIIFEIVILGLFLFAVLSLSQEKWQKKRKTGMRRAGRAARNSNRKVKKISRQESYPQNKQRIKKDFLRVQNVQNEQLSSTIDSEVNFKIENLLPPFSQQEKKQDEHSGLPVMEMTRKEKKKKDGENHSR